MEKTVPGLRQGRGEVPRAAGSSGDGLRGRHRVILRGALVGLNLVQGFGFEGMVSYNLKDLCV